MNEANLQKQNELAPDQEVQLSLQEKGITDTLIQELKQFSGLKNKSVIDENGNYIEDKEGLKQITESRIKIKNTRVLIEKTCKAFRDVNTAKNRLISAKEDEFVKAISPIEKELAEQEKISDDLKAEIERKKEQERKAVFDTRCKTLIEHGAVYDVISHAFVTTDNTVTVSESELLYMEPEHFSKVTDQFSAVHIAHLLKLEEEKAAKKAEQDAIKKQRLENEAKEKELKAIQDEQDRKAKELQDQQDKINAENKRVEDLRLAKIAEDKRLADIEAAKKEAQEKQAEEKKILDAKNAKADDFIKRLIANRYHAESATSYSKGGFKVDRDALLECTEQEFVDRVEEVDEKILEAEKIAKEKEAKRIARMPDKKLLMSYATELISVKLPDMKTKEGADTLAKIAAIFKASYNEIKTEIEKL